MCCSRWPFKNEENEYTVETTATSTSSDVTNGSDHTENSELKEHLLTWLSVSADNIVILILLLALAVKFIFFEDRGDVARRLQYQGEEEATAEERVEFLDNSNSLDSMNSTAMDISLRQRFDVSLPTIQQPIFPLSGVGGEWIEVDNEANVEYTDKEVQTDVVSHGLSELSLKKTEPPRSVEDCLEIYKSEVRNQIFISRKHLYSETSCSRVSRQHLVRTVNKHYESIPCNCKSVEKTDNSSIF